MKRRIFIKVTVFSATALPWFPLFAQTPGKQSPPVKPFVHPGLLHNRDELAFIRLKIAEGAEPWKSAWEKLRDSESASLKYKPRPRTEVVRGPYNNPNIGSSELSSDAAAAYAHALQWCLTGNEAHAAKAIEILNAWSTSLKTVSGHDTKLLIGMTGVSPPERDGNAV